jgi:LytS/YehU family sensor histidine kinase
MIYIELEQLRFDNKFDFNCVVDDSVNLDDVHIPPMLLQPYIENAIWHGLMHKKEKGSLTLNFSKNGSTILCMIDDDGIGRERAMELKSLSATRYKSMGMGITKDRIEIMNNMQSLGIGVEVEDKHDDEGKPSGTRVLLRIPIEL